MSRHKRYKIENNKTILEISVSSLDQLFDKRDPNPYRTKDLDEDIVEYLISSTQEVGYRSLGGIQIISPIEWSTDDKNDLEVAIKDFFLYREEITLKQLTATLMLGVKTLFIGIAFLSFAVTLPFLAKYTAAGEIFDKFLTEGFLLIGWVSMWKPINIFLYEWWPLADVAKIHRKLAGLRLSFSVSPDLKKP